MPCTLQSDVEFYGMVHEMIRAQLTEDEFANRRGQERIAYTCTQWIAPMIGDAPPAETEYHEVDCRDISTGGFSYLSDEVPEADTISVRFRKPDEWMFLKAAIAHCRPVDTDRGPGYLIGCRFVGRI